VLALSPYSPITAWGSKLAQIPLWLFQGTADTFAPIAETKELVSAIQKAGGHPRFNSLDGRDHFILDVYDHPDVYEWLLQQKANQLGCPATTKDLTNRWSQPLAAVLKSERLK